MSDKATLRRALITSRNAMPADVRRQADAVIGARINAWWRENPVSILGVYWPIKSEPDLRNCYAQLSAAGVQLALPVVTDKTSPLAFAQWDTSDLLATDAMGIAIPAPPHRLVQPQALLIPCVGFNAERVRLGYGGGFYDRTLASAPRPFTLGVGYARAQAAFEGAAHDIALDMIITEQGVLAAI